ncbi:MAG: hypothetical protein IJE05_05800 [Clostridia bacterium]|nr:hypothetical protein [Clostridia bacterium]
MENASKALVMAGGILIAILVIGALLLMVNQIGDYEKAQTSNVKDSQLAQFNYDFERYTDDNGITGADIITIINKVVDFNKKEGVSNSVNYDIKMSVTITGLNDFKKNHTVESGVEDLFSGNNLVMGANGNNNFFSEIITRYTDYENKYTLSGINRLASSYNQIKTKMKEEKFSESSSKYKELIEEITGKNMSNVPTLAEISQYSQYSEFKRATFVSHQNSVYENGQIKDLYFKFVE